MNRISRVVLLGTAFVGGWTVFGADGVKESQGAMTRPATQESNARDRQFVPHYSAGTGVSEVLALNFVIPAKSCMRLDSSFDLMGADVIAIAIVGLNADIRKTRLIPFFGVDGAPYMVASGRVLQGDSFYSYMDAGSGTLPVLGSQMFVRVCNDSADAIRYSQLTCYVPHR